ncbi:MAG: TrmB family transcriptional regulator [Candidatus Bathyarchaeota archaeon]|nr:MAG: TrmB family transcriptional regulator [Candidatus Bathyarchaeota archaeon]
MSITEKTKQSLREIGLTGYESTAYLFLLVSGPATAGYISKSTSLPYSKIYNILMALEEKGWVDVASGRPKRYFPKSPSEALEATTMQVESTLANNVNQILDELQPLYSGRELQERPDIWIVRGEFNIIAKIKEYISEARQQLMFAATFLPKPLLEYLLSDVSRLHEHGITINILLTATVASRSLLELNKFGEVRVKDQMFGNGIIVDGKKVILLLGRGTNSTYLAICSDHLGLAELSKEYFEYLWHDAQILPD